VPVLLPPGEELPAALLDGLHGLVLAGGGDIHPGRVGREAHDATYSVCPERDDFELALVEDALARGLPTLAICRGLQVLNLALGGDLLEHLPDDGSSPLRHRESQERATRHGVVLEPDSRLAQVFGRLELDVASWHHQAVGSLGSGLRAVAHAPDGTVEAVEIAEAPWLMAVQWHPELDLEADSPQRLLLAGFVELARGRRA
jgi:putative glutamine amidotransferase